MAVWLVLFGRILIISGAFLILLVICGFLAWLLASDESPLPDKWWVRIPVVFIIFIATITTLVYMIQLVKCNV